MTRTTHWFRNALLATVLSMSVVSSLPAAAQEAGQLPVFVSGPQAAYPAQALADGQDANVLLQLDIDASGRVVGVAIAESAGEAFDAAAIEAAYSFLFEPALDADGNPSAARILFRTQFQATAIDTQASDDTSSEPDAIPATAPAVIEEPTGEQITVSARRTNPEVTERVLSTEQVRYLPGTSGDVVRAVQNLPGVARPPLSIGQLLIRGTAPEDSGYTLDGAKIPLVFHFSGLSTVLDAQILDEVALMPGGYGVRYGRTLGGTVDLRVDSELPEQSTGKVAIDVYQATFAAQQRVSERTALTLSGRRSWIDAILGPVLNNGASKVQAPRYYDLQARVLHESERAGTLDAMFFLSDDRFRVLGGANAPSQDEVQIGLATHFQKLRLRWTTDLPSGWRSETVLLAGPQANVFQIAPDGEASERAFVGSLREEITGRPTSWLRLQGGLDLLAADESFLYDVSAFGAPEQGDARWVSPALYLEPAVTVGAFRFTPGVRFDPLFVDNGYSTWSTDPRMGLTVDAGPTTTLDASIGRYSQPPTLRQIMAEGGADAPLTSSSAYQASVGIEQALSLALQLETTAFYHRLDGLVVGREDRFSFFTGPPPIGPFDIGAYANDGTGTIFGVETRLSLETKKVTAWLSATTSRSVRVKRPGDETRLFTYDQPLVLTALGSASLSRGWRLGSRVRLGSGNPYTPVVNRIHELDDARFVPVYGKVDSDRLPTFFSLDVRVDKEWTFDQWSLTASLDLQNATNTPNVEVMSWTPDYSETAPITSLPILPAFGLEAAW
jgi:TonB family protein